MTNATHSVLFVNKDAKLERNSTNFILTKRMTNFGCKLRKLSSHSSKCIIYTSVDSRTNLNVENAGVALVKGANERNGSFEKINKQLYMANNSGRTR